MAYHFIGIKGTGMAALACILHDEHKEVTGSDIDKYIFTEDGNVEQKFPFHVSSPGEYSITTVMHGCIWDEETEEWQEREIKQQFQVEVEKLSQKLQDVREKLTLRYGDTLDVAEYVAAIYR